MVTDGSNQVAKPVTNNILVTPADIQELQAVTNSYLVTTFADRGAPGDTNNRKLVTALPFGRRRSHKRQSPIQRTKNGNS